MLADDLCGEGHSESYNTRELFHWWDSFWFVWHIFFPAGEFEWMLSEFTAPIDSEAGLGERSCVLVPWTPWWLVSFGLTPVYTVSQLSAKWSPNLKLGGLFKEMQRQEAEKVAVGRVWSFPASAPWKCPCSRYLYAAFVLYGQCDSS